jgi:hypothetical protein
LPISNGTGHHPYRYSPSPLPPSAPRTARRPNPVRSHSPFFTRDLLMCVGIARVIWTCATATATAASARALALHSIVSYRYRPPSLPL